MLLGKVLISVTDNKETDEIIFQTADEKFMQHHHQNCCEHVFIESIVGDLQDLIGSPILLAQAVTSTDKQPAYKMVTDDDMQEGDSFTWTFYKLATIKGYVDIRWFGSSNGYYPEDVDFVQIIESED